MKLVGFQHFRPHEQAVADETEAVRVTYWAAHDNTWNVEALLDEDGSTLMTRDQLDERAFDLVEGKDL